MDYELLKNDQNWLTKYNGLRDVFISLDYKKVNILGIENFYINGEYYRIDYLKSMGFIIEYAESLEDAKKNVYDDVDSFYIDDINEFLAEVKEYLKKYCM